MLPMVMMPISGQCGPIWAQGGFRSERKPPSAKMATDSDDADAHETNAGPFWLRVVFVWNENHLHPKWRRIRIIMAVVIIRIRRHFRSKGVFVGNENHLEAKWLRIVMLPMLLIRIRAHFASRSFSFGMKPTLTQNGAGVA